MQDSALPAEKQLFGHPVGLYILFLTEMWERFSFYGMRALLVLYIVTETIGDERGAGLGWSNQEALALYGWYTMLVYVMAIPGGMVADKLIGQKKSVLSKINLLESFFRFCYVIFLSRAAKIMFRVFVSGI